MSLNKSLLLSLLLSACIPADAFLTKPSDNINKSRKINSSPLLLRRQTLFARDIGAEDVSSKEYWLDEFKAPSGEILNPYKVLKLKRDATILQIKNAYREQSRRYHPDTQRFKDMLPGSCNNLDDVRDEWERIKLSYEILRDPRTRKRYDRHEVLADPGAAVGRAVADAALGVVGKGIAGIGSGIFAMGAFALDKMSGESAAKKAQDEEH